MKRGLTGEYDISTVAGEQIEAFVPGPLAPIPPLQLDSQRQKLLEKATLALGRLDSVTLLCLQEEENPI